MRFTIQVIDALMQEIDENRDEIELAKSYADVVRINEAGKIAVLLSFEGAEMLGQDLSTLRLFYQVGLRMLSFTWMRRTLFGDGTWENDTRGGLTRLGRAAVKEMEPSRHHRRRLARLRPDDLGHPRDVNGSGHRQSLERPRGARPPA